MEEHRRFLFCFVENSSLIQSCYPLKSRVHFVVRSSGLDDTKVHIYQEALMVGTKGSFVPDLIRPALVFACGVLHDLKISQICKCSFEKEGIFS